jgi:poly(A) polymerase
MSGYAEVTWQRLAQQKLVEYLFPATFHAMEVDDSIYSSADLIRQACHNTDHRIRTEQRVTPAFIFAVILWPAVVEEEKALLAEGQPPLAALHQAMQIVLSEQSQHIAIPRRFTNTMREIWELQMRLPKRHGSQAQRLVQHPRFRAAYDFLLLRESAGEQLQQLGQWWTDFQQADEGQRNVMVNALAAPKGRSRRRRKPKAPANRT